MFARFPSPPPAARRTASSETPGVASGFARAALVALVAAFLAALVPALAACGGPTAPGAANPASGAPGALPAASAGPSAAGPDEAAIARVLARHREASGGAAWDQLAFLEQRGTIAVGGLSGELSSLEDVRDGRSRSRYTLGPASGAQGFDGQLQWRLDPGGEVVVEDSVEALARGKTSAWLSRRGFLRPAGAVYRWLGDRDDAGKHYATIEATPEGGAAVQLWFDTATGLLARTVSRQGLDTITTHLDDYQALGGGGGVQVPMRLTIDSGEPRNLTTVIILAAAPLASATADVFARPSAPSDHLTFSGPARETELPFELVNNHIYVRATVNGQPVRLLVDTGGINLLTKAAVKRLGLSADGTMAARGAGEKQVDMGLAKASILQLGALQVRDPLFYVFDFAELLAIEDIAFDGLVGFELFNRFIVRIDYAAGRIRLTDPASATAPAAAVRVPFVLAGRVPLVEGELDGVAARLLIDTGSRASLTIASPFVAKHGLVARHRPPFETITGWGVGGPVRSSPVRLAEVKLGGAVLRAVLGDLYTGEQGAFADPRADANVGGGILRRFTVTFDYGKRIMYLEPNANAAEPDRYDRSGLFLLRRGPAIEVAAVAATSPAERAGVLAKDLVRAIDGVAVARHPVAEWRRRLRDSPPGTKVTLTVERGGKRQKIVLTLAELVP